MWWCKWHHSPVSSPKTHPRTTSGVTTAQLEGLFYPFPQFGENPIQHRWSPGRQLQEEGDRRASSDLRVVSLSDVLQKTLGVLPSRSSKKMCKDPSVRIQNEVDNKKTEDKYSCTTITCALAPFTMHDFCWHDRTVTWNTDSKTAVSPQLLSPPCLVPKATDPEGWSLALIILRPPCVWVHS